MVDQVQLSQIVALITAALTDFYMRDANLFRDGDASNAVSERTMTARIALYLERHRNIIGYLDDLSIDLEYNRNFDAPKSYYSMLSMHRRNAVPDLLIHRRNSNDDNLLVIEFKKARPAQSDYQHDLEKLLYFTDQRHEYRFRFGMYIELHPREAHIEIYHHGRRSVVTLHF